MCNFWCTWQRLLFCAERIVSEKESKSVREHDRIMNNGGKRCM